MILPSKSLLQLDKNISYFQSGTEKLDRIVTVDCSLLQLKWPMLEAFRGVSVQMMCSVQEISLKTKFKSKFWIYIPQNWSDLWTALK